MPVDPSRCPIPPGFKVLGNFSDEFDHFKETTGYGTVFVDREHGYSNRWKNSEIRSDGIVAGFQFRIGPNGGQRWTFNNKLQKHVLRDVNSGDVNLFFPRTASGTHISHWSDIGGIFSSQRGNYLVGIKWDEDLMTHASLGKEIPHNTYGGINQFEKPFRNQPNPTNRPNNPRNGQWHTFLAVIYNDWYRRHTFVTSGLFPTIGLWYSPVATFNFDNEL